MRFHAMTDAYSWEGVRSAPMMSNCLLLLIMALIFVLSGCDQPSHNNASRRNVVQTTDVRLERCWAVSGIARKDYVVKAELRYADNGAQVLSSSCRAFQILSGTSLKIYVWVEYIPEKIIYGIEGLCVLGDVIHTVELGDAFYNAVINKCSGSKSILIRRFVDFGAVTQPESQFERIVMLDVRSRSMNPFFFLISGEDGRGLPVGYGLSPSGVLDIYCISRYENRDKALLDNLDDCLARF
jgi:hypothetical protein